MKKSTSNLIKGAGTVIQISPKTSKSLTRLGTDSLPPSPTQAIRGDWQKVGKSIRTALTKVPSPKTSNGKRKR